MPEPRSQHSTPPSMALQQPAGGAEWVLEEFPYQKHTYLIDRRTNFVYAEAQESQWPEMVGRLQNNGSVAFKKQADAMDLFKAMDSKLKAEQTRFSDLFKRFDADGSGALDIQELSRLVAVRAGCSPARRALCWIVVIAFLGAMRPGWCSRLVVHGDA